jgi:hypothetical protein
MFINALNLQRDSCQFASKLNVETLQVKEDKKEKKIDNPLLCYTCDFFKNKKNSLKHYLHIICFLLLCLHPNVWIIIIQDHLILTTF